MAKDTAGDSAGKKSGGLVPLILLTLIAAGAGAAQGLQTYKVVHVAGPAPDAGSGAAAGAAAAGAGATEKPAQEAAAGGHGAPAAGGHGAPAAEHGAAKDGKSEPVRLPSKIVVREIPAVVTNVAMPPESWIRLEAIMVYDQAQIPNPDVVAGEISGDLMTYLRSISLREIQGPEGLMYLRQDMKERVALRTEGKVRDLIIQTLVVQ